MAHRWKFRTYDPSLGRQRPPSRMLEPDRAFRFILSDCSEKGLIAMLSSGRWYPPMDTVEDYFSARLDAETSAVLKAHFVSKPSRSPMARSVAAFSTTMLIRRFAGLSGSCES